MQSDRSAGTAALSGTVRGLGVCDALQVELDGTQRAGLARAIDETSASLAVGPPEDAAQRGDERRLLALLRDRLPASPGGRFAVAGPADVVARLVHRCLVDAVRSVALMLEDGPPAAWSPELEHAAAVAGAWIATARHCRAVERYCFEPGVDPPRPR